MTKIKKIGKDGLEHEYWQLDEADKAKLKWKLKTKNEKLKCKN